LSHELTINEIFHSIQGEGTCAGRPCVFVRLTGCHLRCAYCDTAYAFHEGSRMRIDAVVERVRQHRCDLVQITGGEPLLQAHVHELMKGLADLGRTVLLETSGACDISACDPRVIRIVDVKTPDSGESKRNDWSLLENLRGLDEVKFVICSRRDYEWSRDLVGRHGLDRRVASVLFSPVHEMPAAGELAGAAGMPLRQLADWILADDLPVRLQPQIHKFIWDPMERGV
jgi:7-carboxy-7-deazaguanine synthase